MPPLLTPIAVILTTSTGLGVMYLASLWRAAGRINVEREA